MIKIANHCHYHKALARKLVEQVKVLAITDDFLLQIEDDHIALCTRIQRQKTCFRHSLTQPKLLRRAQQKNQALFRACNNKKRELTTVCDLTAGWGKDSLMLANHGQRVEMLEQHPVIFQCMNFLLQIARHEKPHTVYDQMNLRHENSLDYLATRDRGFADCLYLDPMFPAHKSCALPGKDLQILQRLTQNRDMEDVFRLALEKAGHRVVVKRPLHAQTLDAQKPDIVYREKTIRFDVYMSR